MLKKSLIFLLGCFVFVSAFASVEMQLDKDNIADDEVLTLIITSKDHISISPDLSPLRNDFQVVGTSRNTQVNIINGVTQMQTQWQIALLPKHEGDIVIPELQIGGEKTQSHIVHVQSVKKNVMPQKAAANQDIFIEAKVIPKEAYIQEQLIYTLKLFFRVSIENPYLMPPDLADAKITQNGQDIIYTTVKNGKAYRVLERSYLITPKNTGNFEIQPPILKGYLENAIDQFDAYGFANHTLKPIKVVGPIVEINVKPSPSGFRGQWLPAKKLTLSESWEPNPPVFKEGEPVTRVIQVTAEGATGDQIPNLVLSSSPNLNSYPQQAKRDTDTNGEVQIGKFKQKIVFIPTSSGKVVFPAIKVHWWNSIKQKEQITTLPQKTVKVLPAMMKTSVNNQLQLIPKNKSLVATQLIKNENAKPKVIVKTKNLFWPSVAIFFIIIWLATFWMWRRQIKLGSNFASGRDHFSASETQTRLKEACFANNAKQTRRFFLGWAAARWNNASLHSLSDVVHVLETDNALSLVDEIMRLEAIFYGKSKQQWNGAAFWHSFQAYLQMKEVNSSKNNNDPLPPLYFTG